jgi:hypothetical protein
MELSAWEGRFEFPKDMIAACLQHIYYMTGCSRHQLHSLQHVHEITEEVSALPRGLERGVYRITSVQSGKDMMGTSRSCLGGI